MTQLLPCPNCNARTPHAWHPNGRRVVTMDRPAGEWRCTVCEKRKAR